MWLVYSNAMSGFSYILCRVTLQITRGDTHCMVQWLRGRKWQCRFVTGPRSGEFHIFGCYSGEYITVCAINCKLYITINPRRNLFGINSYRPVLPIVDVEVRKLWAKLDTNNVDYIVGTNSHDHYGPYASWNVKLCEIFELPGRGQVIDVRSKVFAIWDLVPL